MATEYIIEEEALPTQSSDIAADKKYYPISIESDGETFKIENNGTAAARYHNPQKRYYAFNY